MPYYETVLIARQELSQGQVDDLTKDLSKIITDNGGKVHKTEYWGLRTLAYRINKSRKGHYVLMETDTPPAAIAEMERNMRLNEDVMRFMTIKEEELSDGPSVMMDKGGDRDRKDNRYGKKEAA